MQKRKIDLSTIKDGEIIRGFYLSQGLLLVIAIVLFVIFYDKQTHLNIFFNINIGELLLLGVGSGAVLALLEGLLDRLLPDAWFDDGGINNRVFEALTTGHIFFAMLVVAVIEEFLFRGVLQSNFGLIIASLLFGFVHFRYIRKPLMLCVALALGFYLGWLFQITDSLWVPVACHYTIDVVLGLFIKHKIKAEK